MADLGVVWKTCFEFSYWFLFLNVFYPWAFLFQCAYILSFSHVILILILSIDVKGMVLPPVWSEYLICIPWKLYGVLLGLYTSMIYVWHSLGPIYFDCSCMVGKFTTVFASFIPSILLEPNLSSSVMNIQPLSN